MKGVNATKFLSKMSKVAYQNTTNSFACSKNWHWIHFKEYRTASNEQL